MTAPTPETLVRHELAGLPVRVADATNDALVGIQGRVRRETERTLVVDCGDRTRVVPKAEATLEVALTDETADAPARAGAAGTTRAGPASGSVACEGSGTTSELASCGDTFAAGAGEGVAYVTVDGARLLSRPALRTEHTGDSKWESD